jgi:hypothetical protein
MVDQDRTVGRCPAHGLTEMIHEVESRRGYRGRHREGNEKRLGCNPPSA